MRGELAPQPAIRVTETERLIRCATSVGWGFTETAGVINAKTYRDRDNPAK
jgi:hypothetical protein